MGAGGDLSPSAYIRLLQFPHVDAKKGGSAIHFIVALPRFRDM